MPQEWVLSFAKKFDMCPLSPSMSPLCVLVPMPYGIIGPNDEDVPIPYPILGGIGNGPAEEDMPVPYSILGGIGVGVATSTSWKMQRLAGLLDKPSYCAPEFLEEVGLFPGPKHEAHDVSNLLLDFEAEQVRSSLWLSMQRVKIARKNAIKRTTLMMFKQRRWKRGAAGFRVVRAMNQRSTSWTPKSWTPTLRKMPEALT